MNKVIMRNIHTGDEATAILVEINKINGCEFYTVKWFGAQETISSYQGWTIKESS